MTSTKNGDGVNAVAVLLEELRESTCMTWQQVATLFGVSRRTVHLWLVGERMPVVRIERLHELVGRIREQQFESSDEANRWLFWRDGDKTRFSVWSNEGGAGRPVFTVMEELDREEQWHKLWNDLSRASNAGTETIDLRAVEALAEGQ